MRQLRQKYQQTEFILAVRDILSAPVEVIVNPANGYLAHGGGLAAAISSAAGPDLDRASVDYIQQHGPLATSESAITTSGRLLQQSGIKAVIHTVGPRMGEGNEQEKLEQAFKNSLLLAQREGFTSIALPAISTGIFGVDKKTCAFALLQVLNQLDTHGINLNTIMLCLTEHDFDVFASVLFTTEASQQDTVPGSNSQTGDIELSEDEINMLQNSDDVTDSWFTDK